VEATVNITSGLPALIPPLLLCACSTNSPIPDQDGSAHEPLPIYPVQDTQRETILIVSLEDGSVIKQIISIDADLCFKMNASTSTTCLTQGDPIVDPVTNTIIAYEMIEDHVDLIPRPD
jgi:hypothetical protein